MYFYMFNVVHLLSDLGFHGFSMNEGHWSVICTNSQRINNNDVINGAIKIPIITNLSLHMFDLETQNPPTVTIQCHYP